MKGEEFFDKLGNVNPKLVAEAAKTPARTRRPIGRTLVIAACLCLLAGGCIFAASALLGNDAPAPESQGEYSDVYVGTTSRTEVGQPLDILHAQFYVPASDGSCRVESVEYDLKTRSFSVENAASDFIRLCGLEGVALKGHEFVTLQEAEESKGGGIVSYKPAVKSLTLTFEGEKPDELTLKCLVNTMLRGFAVRGVEIVFGGEPVTIDGEKPENGFAEFQLIVK